jgi:hypothetical protein
MLAYSHYLKPHWAGLQNLNVSSNVAFEGKYSLELIYGWPLTWLTFAASLAFLLNFGVDLGHMLRTGDVSTTWTIASYDVAGGKYLPYYRTYC